ncbi:hypothetical protein ACHAXT_001443 [Thalassiosira profunda]
MTHRSPKSRERAITREDKATTTANANHFSRNRLAVTMPGQSSSPPSAAGRLLVAAAAVLAVQQRSGADAFSGSRSPIPIRLCPHQRAALTPSTTRLPMAAGMGMAAKPKGKKPKKGGKGKGAGKKSPESYDVSKAMIKSEKRYDELMTASIKALHSDDEAWEESEITAEYIVAARCRPGATLKDNPSALVAARDWIPVAQVVITRPVHLHEEDDGAGVDASVRQAISHYCREISYSATLASPATFRSLPRNILEYSAEPLDSFVKHVYEDVMEGKASDSFVDGDVKVDMTKSKAREILGLEVGCKDAAEVKRAYKKRSLEWHPDREGGSAEQFGMAKMAYEALLSGVREVNGSGNGSSWYESLGGKARTEFVGPIELMSVDKAGAYCNKAFKSAVAGVDPELTMAFVARNQAAAR